MTAVDPRSCSASASTARLFAGMPPPFRLTLGPVLTFAMSPPKNYEALVPERKRGQQHGHRRASFSPPQDLSLSGAGFSGYEVVPLTARPITVAIDYAVARPPSPSVAPRSSFTLGPCVLVTCAARTY